MEKIRTREAFTEVVKAYYAGLYDFALGYTRSPDAAKDLLQDVLLALWEGRATIAPGHGIRAYLYGAVRNRALNYLRDRKPSLDPPDIRSGEAPDAGLQLDDLIRDYQRTIAELPERRQEVFRLSRLYGLTYEEIAEVMGISVNTVRTHMAAALQHMRIRLAHHFF